jgi:hypothetical protein
MAINWFQPRTLLGAWEQTGKRARTFLQDMFFSRRFMSSTEHIDMDEVIDNRIMAAFSAVDGSGKTVNRIGFKGHSYTPPALKPRMNMKQLDLMQRMPGESVYDGMKPEEREVALVQRDLLRMSNMNTRRREWMCAQTMFGGTVAMVGDDYSQTLDFGLTMTETLAGNALWSASATATPLDDLERWMLAVLAETGVMPDKCVMAADVAQAFMKCTQVTAEATKMQNVLLRIDPTPLPEYPGATSLGYYKTPTGYLVEVFVYTEYYETVNAAGTVTRAPMVPAGKLVLANPTDSFVLAFGAYTDLSTQPAVTYQVEEYPRQWYDGDTNIRWMELVSRPLTAPTLTNGWYCATVL